MINLWSRFFFTSIEIIGLLFKLCQRFSSFHEVGVENWTEWGWRLQAGSGSAEGWRSKLVTRCLDQQRQTTEGLNTGILMLPSSDICSSSNGGEVEYSPVLVTNCWLRKTGRREFEESIKQKENAGKIKGKDFVRCKMCKKHLYKERIPVTMCWGVSCVS